MAAQMQSSKPTGPGAAAVVAAGVGTFTIGLMTSLAEASAGLSKSLNWYNPSGPLSGKIGVAVVAWLLAWVILHAAWKRTWTSGAPSLAPPCSSAHER
jgi:hypothetical protein